MVRVAGVEPAWTCAQDMWVAATLPGLWERAFQPSPALSLHADNLAQRVYHVDQIALRFHHCIDGLVRHRCFVDDVGILTALDARSRPGMIVQRKAALRFCTRHGLSGSMAAAHEAFRIALSTDDVRARSHAARDNSHVAFACPDCFLTRDEHVLAVVVLPGHVVVMAAHNFVAPASGRLSSGRLSPLPKS